MIILEYKKKHHKKIIVAAVAALRAGRAVVYPTDTSYGLAVNAGNNQALQKLYKIKQRRPNQPIHVVAPSLSYAKGLVVWNKFAEKLAKKFWPGPLTLVLPIKTKNSALAEITGGTGTLGLRMPKNDIALDLAKALGEPITATSANPSKHLAGGFDSYSTASVISQFNKQKHRPDIIIDAGKLPKHKPSTMVKVFDDVYKILRHGPITEKQIKHVLSA